MIRSMTGFGAAKCEVQGVRYVVEIRSLNNKFFKAQVRLQDELQGLESELESAISKRLHRGSIILTIRFTDLSSDAGAKINVAALSNYLKQLRAIDGVDQVDPAALLDLPGVLMADNGNETADKARKPLMDLAQQACDAVIAMRVREGETLHADLHTHCSRIEEHLVVIRDRAPVIVELYQERLRQRMEALLQDADRVVREDDLLREVAIFADRSDIAEEISRLGGHLDQFREIIDGESEEPVGRSLDFLSQEMLREANTIASKCLDVEVSRRIVEIKSAIDRIKEQAQNVE